MAGMLLVSLVIYLHFAFIFLAVFLILWWQRLHGWKVTVLLCILTLLFYGSCCLRNSGFLEERQGEIVYLSQSGFQIGDTFYQGDVKEVKLGDIVTVKASKADFPYLRNEGGFDQKHFLMGKGIKYMAENVSYEVVGHRWHLREWAVEMIKARADPELLDIYLYLLLGMRSEEVQSLLDMAKELAVLHLFAISGLHFNLLKKALAQLLAMAFSEKTAARISIFLMGIYAVILRGNVAAWRAYLMMVLKETRRWTPLQCFGLTGCFFLWMNPQIIFQLAFIYSMSIYFLVTLCHRQRFSNLIIFTASMMISTYFQYEIYPLGYLAGLLFTHMITLLFPLFVLDLMGGGLISGFNLRLYQGMLEAMRFLCRFSLSIVTGKPPLILIFIFYLGLVYAIYHQRFYHRRKFFIIPLLSILAVIVYPQLRFYGTVTMIDVGQGDSFLIQLPFNQANILIDTGGLDYQDVALKRLIPFFKSQGMTSLDAVYLSHQDFDHCGALESLEANFPVQKVIWTFAKDTYAGVTLTQLNTHSWDNPNDNSLVILVKLGSCQYLFTGDISSQVEDWLAKTYPDLQTDILKVAHHGSSTSSSADFLSQLNGRVAMISVGLHNRYHHPSEKVVDRLLAYGYEILRTDWQGAVKIYFTKTHTWIEKEKN